jgi:hypothetical protein
MWLWWYWPAWLALIVLAFAPAEFIALKYHQGPSFSMFMWWVTTKWPEWAYLWGTLTGGLGVHFWWHWNPPPSFPPGSAG